jgi:DNA repair ATPase RecN
MQLADLEKAIAIAENRLQNLEGQKEVLSKQHEENLTAIKVAEAKNDIFLKASTLLQLVSEKTRERSIEKMEAIVTQAIQEVYGDKALKFKILFENKRNAVSVEFKLWDDSLKQYLNIIRCEAGGIKAIVAAILRLVVVDLYNPRIEGPIVLDEVGSQISVEYQSRFGQFLQQYSKLTGRQIILVSHQSAVATFADKCIRLKRIGDESSEIGS